MEIQPGRGCHATVTRLYPPFVRKRDLGQDRKGLKALAFFYEFR